ncbi:MAG: very short patch repair endonuclease [Alloprevotella sp.]|nr:very short patch repair endonuclease [Alloprevotella sp.]
MDKLTVQQRHANMAAIRSKGTKPEMVVRRGLWKRGFRYRLNHKRLPGHPDLVLRKYRTCIFVNGCFWHGHRSLTPVPKPHPLTPSPKVEGEAYGGEGSEYILTDSACCKIPKTNREFWVNKIRRNKERDLRVQCELASLGWHSITIWECELTPKMREKTLDALAYTLNKIFLQDHSIRRYEVPVDAPMMAAEDSPEYNHHDVQPQ